MTYDISIYGSAYRVEKWMALYQSIGTNKISFEIVFAGPREPTYPLPKNFKFIKTDVKPAQCLEIAARETQADLIMQLADDVCFQGSKPLDRLYAEFVAAKNSKLILSCRYMRAGVDVSQKEHRFFVTDQASPIMPLSGLMERQLYRGVGGIDRNFIAVFWDLDIAMRVYSIGGEVQLSAVYLNEAEPGSGVCTECGEQDRSLVDRLWSVNGKCIFSRSQGVEPFSNYRILEESQGPKGRWV